MNTIGNFQLQRDNSSLNLNTKYLHKQQQSASPVFALVFRPGQNLAAVMPRKSSSKDQICLTTHQQSRVNMSFQKKTIEKKTRWLYQLLNWSFLLNERGSILTEPSSVITSVTLHYIGHSMFHTFHYLLDKTYSSVTVAFLTLVFHFILYHLFIQIHLSKFPHFLENFSRVPFITAAYLSVSISILSRFLK